MISMNMSFPLKGMCEGIRRGHAPESEFQWVRSVDFLDKARVPFAVE